MSHHDPRTWYWPEGMPESLRGGKSSEIRSSVPDLRDNRDPEKLGNAILANKPRKLSEPEDKQLDFGDDWQLKGYDA